MEQKKKSKSWPQVGTIRRGESGSYIKLADGVEIFKDGEKVPLNDKNTLRLEDPRKKVESLAASGYITEAEAATRLEKLATLEWLRFEIIAPPPKPKV